MPIFYFKIDVVTMENNIDFIMKLMSLFLNKDVNYLLKKQTSKYGNKDIRLYY